MLGPDERRGVGIDIDEPPVHLAVGRAAVDRRNRLAEGAVVEHGAVDEAGCRRIEIGADVALEIALEEILASWPFLAELREQLINLGDLRRRKRARKRRGRARGEGECRRVVECEIAFDLAARPPPVVEVQYLAVLKLLNERRIVDLDALQIAVIVGDGNEEIEILARGQERSGRRFRRAHRGDGIVHQFRHAEAVERRLEPARAHEQR